jgi:hypothetical protein
MDLSSHFSRRSIPVFLYHNKGCHAERTGVQLCLEGNVDLAGNGLISFIGCFEKF